MKTGKYISLGTYNDIKIGYGTVDFKNLKTIYLKFNSWLQPNNETDNFDLSILKSRREIKRHISTLSNINFKPESIVDLDIKTNGIKKDKRSFMNLEVTLFVNTHFNIKSQESKMLIRNLVISIIENCLLDKNLFNFNERKK